jgi:hypothetical protein
MSEDIDGKDGNLLPVASTSSMLLASNCRPLILGCDEKFQGALIERIKAAFTKKQIAL